MSRRGYGEYCGLARALELVGERWGLLVVRDLMFGPKRFTELRRGLPRIPSNVLSARLKEFEEAGVVRRRVLPRPASGVVYELTVYGYELEPILVSLGMWGAKALGEPLPDDSFSAEALLLALRGTFQPEAARGLRATYELRVREIVVHACVDEAALEVGSGPPAGDPDLVLETDLSLRRLLAGELTPDEALDREIVRITGPRELLGRFVDAFCLPGSEPLAAQRG